MRDNRSSDGGRSVDLPYMIRQAARCFPDSMAVDDGATALSTSKAVARAERVANQLDVMGLEGGAAIGILSENRSAYVEADLAIALSRRVRVALNARLHLEDHRYIVGDSKMRALFYSPRFAEEAGALQEEFGMVTVSLESGEGCFSYEDLVTKGRAAPTLRPGDAEDAAWITYTSGTTGTPKGIVLSHRSIREVAFNLLLEFGPLARGEQIVLTQPLSHGSGYFVLPALIAGGGLYVMPRFDPEEVFALSERPNVRTLKIVPAMLPALVEMDGRRRFGYETVIYGASPIQRPVLGAALERFGPVLAQIYGQSEAPVTITCLHKDDHLEAEGRSHSAGRPFRSVAVEVRDAAGDPVAAGETGEVAVRGSHLMSRYHGMPEATADVMQDGWILTRDMGVFDDMGFLHLRGRKDEMIISGGYNISPREVEQVLCQFPGVEEAVVLGIPDVRWGSAVMAVVKLSDGTAAGGNDLMAFARERLGFRAPKAMTFVDSIPRNPYGKIDRTGLVAAVSANTGESNDLE